MKREILLICVLAAGFTGACARKWEAASKVFPTRKEVDVKYVYQVDLMSLRNLLKDGMLINNKG